jgi:DNA-directed RNA polymerase subunit M/transcription elongation factor TFIIS
MFAVDDEIDVLCPKCANETVYVEKLIPRPVGERDQYLCRCGKCGWLLYVEAAEPIFVTDAPKIS